MAAAVLSTAALAAFSDLPCLRRISIFDICFPRFLFGTSRGACAGFAMMPQSPLAVPCPVAGPGGRCSDRHEGNDRVRVLLVAIMWVLVTAQCHAAEIIGHIDLSAEGKPLRADETQDAIVYFRPKVPPAVKPVAEIPVMGTRRKQFVPRVLAITVGSQVRFPNEDPIL